MRNSKLIKLLNTFRAEEWKACRKHLISMTSEGAEVIYVYDYIMHYRKDLSHKKLSIEFALSSLFKKKTNKNFRNIMSRLRTMILDYMAIDHMVRDKRELQIHSLMSLNERGLFLEAVNVRNQISSNLNAQPLDIWNSMYQLRADHALKFSDNPAKLTDPKETFTVLYASWRYLQEEINQYYLVDAINEVAARGIDLSQIITEIRNQLFDDNHANETITQLRLLSKVVTNDVKAYSRLLHLIHSSERQMLPSIGSLILLHLIQYQHRMARSGTENMTELLSLYLFGLETGLLLDNGLIADTRFRTMIHASCFSHDEALPYQLMEDWAHTLNKDYKNDVLILCKATILFYQSEYDGSAHSLSTHSFRRIWDRNEARLLLVMNAFMTNKENKEFVLGQIKNCSDYVRRHSAESSKNRFTATVNFLKLLERMVRGESLNVILMEISETDQLIRRSWLRRYIKKELQN